MIEYSTSALDVLTLRPPDPFPLVSFDHQQTSTHTQLPFDGPKHYKSVEPSTFLPIPSPTDIDIDQDDLDFDGAAMTTSKYGVRGVALTVEAGIAVIPH